MTWIQSPNHLLSNRKRLALSQADIARLINAESGDKVCRHERFQRVPDLETALAYEAIYKRSVSELFPGLYQKIEREVAARAVALAKKTDRRTENRRAAYRRDMLRVIAGNQINSPKNQP